MHHPKLFAALILSLFPAFEVYTIAAGTISVEPVGLGFLSFLVFSLMFYGTLALREGVRELRALRLACDRSAPGAPLLRT
jgi:hypothetical protein